MHQAPATWAVFGGRTDIASANSEFRPRQNIQNKSNMYDQTGKRNVDEVVKEFAPLVRRIGIMLVAKMPASVQLDDLIQAGLIGLLDAATRYDPREGATFETYASSRIRGSMLDEVRSTDWLSRGMRKTARQIEAAVQKLEQALKRPPTEAEVANKLSMSLKEYQGVYKTCTVAS